MLDEPTAALGVAQTAEVLNLIERVRDKGLGVIIISHNMDDVRAVADRIVVCGSAANGARPGHPPRPPSPPLPATIGELGLASRGDQGAAQEEVLE